MTNEQEQIRNPRELFERMGVYGNLLTLILNKGIRPTTDNKGEVKVNIYDYKTAEKIVPGIIPQVYRLESMFPPEVAFYGGLEAEELDASKLELILDLTGNNSFANVATIGFKHEGETDRMARAVLGYTPENIEFMIGYGQGVREKNKRMIEQGILSYVCSVITDHNFRQIKGIGSKIMAPVFREIDNLDGKNRSKSYLTTWTDTGLCEPKVNLSHHPGLGFWFRQQYNPLTKEEASKLIGIVEEKHKASGITGRKYDLKEVTPEEINAKLYGANLTRNLGPRGTAGYNIEEKWDKPFAVMPNHYENGWTGIIMVRDPVKIREKMEQKQQ